MEEEAVDEVQHEEGALMQLTLERAGRPDAFDRQLEALMDKLASMNTAEAGAHARALLRRIEGQRPDVPTAGDEYGRLEAASIAYADNSRSAKDPNLLALWTEQWWTVLQTWMRANTPPAAVCVDAGLVADSLETVESDRSSTVPARADATSAWTRSMSPSSDACGKGGAPPCKAMTSRRKRRSRRHGKMRRSPGSKSFGRRFKSNAEQKRLPVCTGHGKTGRCAARCRVNLLRLLPGRPCV